MMSLFNWAIAHKAIAATVAAFVISESLPFIPGKYNGIAQSILSILTPGKPQG